jgi:hypothetical protein
MMTQANIDMICNIMASELGINRSSDVNKIVYKKYASKIATDKKKSFCGAITLKGTSCSRFTRRDSRYCTQHSKIHCAFNAHSTTTNFKRTTISALSAGGISALSDEPVSPPISSDIAKKHMTSLSFVGGIPTLNNDQVNRGSYISNIYYDGGIAKFNENLRKSKRTTCWTAMDDYELTGNRINPPLDYDCELLCEYPPLRDEGVKHLRSIVPGIKLL